MPQLCESVYRKPATVEVFHKLTANARAAALAYFDRLSLAEPPGPEAVTESRLPLWLS